MTRVLIIEDTEDIALGIKEYLERVGMEADAVLTGAAGVEMAERMDPDVVVLDLMLPDISGYEVLPQLRTRNIAAPVLILSAKSDEMSKVRGFREGADDYVTKPFGLRELAARVTVLARRSSQLRAKVPEVRVRDLVIQRAARRVIRGGSDVQLRPKEFDLLATLMEHPNEVLSRLELLASVWAYEPGVESRTVDWHVAELRRKLGDSASEPWLIETVRKAGYRWLPTPGSD